MKVHQFFPDADLGPDHNGEYRCVSCGMPRAHQVHDLPDAPPEAVEIDARILGETEPTD